MIRCKNFSPRLPTFFQGGLIAGLASQTKTINCYIQCKEGKQSPKEPRKETEILKNRISHWEILKADLAEVLITKSVRRLVQGWLTICQKNTVVGGNFSYGY